MKTLLNITNPLRSFAAASVTLLALTVATPAEARDHHRHSCHSSYNPLYGNYAAYHGGRGPTYGYWDRYYYQPPVVVYRPSYSAYPRYGCDSNRSRISVSVGGFRFCR